MLSSRDQQRKYPPIIPPPLEVCFDTIRLSFSHLELTNVFYSSRLVLLYAEGGIRPQRFLPDAPFSRLSGANLYSSYLVSAAASSSFSPSRLCNLPIS